MRASNKLRKRLRKIEHVLLKDVGYVPESMLRSNAGNCGSKKHEKSENKRLCEIRNLSLKRLNEK